MRHERIYAGRSRWTQAHFRWLEEQSFEHPVAGGVPGVRGRGAGGLAPGGGPGRADPPGGHHVVVAARGGGLDQPARRQRSHRGDGAGRTGRPDALRQSSSTDEPSGPGARRTFLGRTEAAERDHQDRQRPCAPRARRDRLDLSLRSPQDSSSQAQGRLGPARVQALAWAAQKRLCGRYRRLSHAGKAHCQVTTAVARELAGFIWAIACEMAGRPHGSRALA